MPDLAVSPTPAHGLLRGTSSSRHRGSTVLRWLTQPSPWIRQTVADGTWQPGRALTHQLATLWLRPATAAAGKAMVIGPTLAPNRTIDVRKGRFIGIS
jgi:hypothetical protein